MTNAISGLAIKTTASAASSTPTSSSNAAGSSSMPTETKNSTAKASRIGSASEAARWLYSDRPTTMPARKAPSAIDTSKTLAAPTAMPSASTSTVSVNNSRERVAATRSSRYGITRLPTTTVNTTSAVTLSAVKASATPTLVVDAPRKTGKSTSAMTVRRSSTTTQPIAICPVWVWRSRWSASTRTSTTVLATDKAMPKMTAPCQPQPAAIAMP